MIKNYIITAFRCLRRNKLLSVVNIAGLSIGLSCVMLIMLFVNDEFSFDKFQAKSPRLFRLVSVSTDSAGKEYTRGITGAAQGPAFAADIPEIESFCRIKPAGWHTITKTSDKNVLQAEVLYTDTSFFNLFSFKVLSGNPKHMLDGRNTVVLTDAQAAKTFGNQNPVGKTIDIEVDDKFETFVVSGVVKNAPVNSSIQFDMLIPFEHSLPADAKERNNIATDWNSSYLNTFFLLHNGTNPQKAQNKFEQAFLKENGANWEKFKKHYGKNITQSYFLQPFLNIHLKLDSKKYSASNGLTNAGDVDHSYILTALGILILIIACINFINIMLARSVKRSKEIGVRKVSGSSKGQLIGQFLSESAIITALAFIPALIMVQLFLPQFSELANKQFDISYLFQFKIVLLFFALWILVSFLAGFYPAFVASGFNPVQTLYGRFKLSGKNTLGRSLVVMQFVIALTLIICTVVFQRQFSFMTHSDQGYKTENVMRVELPYGKPNETQLIKNKLAKQPSIQIVGAKAGDYNKTVFVINKKETDWTYFENIDDQYLQLLQIPLVKGRYFDHNNPADTITSCMVNESFVKTFLDASRSPIGQLIGRPSMEKKGAQMEVVGVVKDYHLNSFREKIEPVYFALDKHANAHNLYVKYMPNQSKAAMEAVQTACKAVLPYDVLSYTFLDDFNRERYTSEEQWKKIVTDAAVIAIIISALGLFALTTLATEQRIKEIGIRKVLGASVSNITTMLSASFIKLVLIAFVIAVPIAWYFMNKWLQDFAYRITLSWWIFALSAILTVLLAFITVSYHTLRAALANPVKSLRSE
jgi:putative ABC transport system permease protein